MSANKSKLLLAVIVAASLCIPRSNIAAQEADTAPSVTAESAPQSELPPFALGVSVTDSPGTGVLVKGVAWGSPAARSGIKPDDFLMAITDQPIEKPRDLRNRLAEYASEKEITVTVWRNGTTLTKSVRFDPRFSDSTREKAWLGVMLQMTEGGDVLIADVMPASPAEEGGIRVGDTVVRMNAENIDSLDELMAIMKKIRSGENVEVTVLRNGKEQTFDVRVGSAVQRTMRWFEERVPFERVERWRNQIPEFEVDRYLESFEGMLDRLRNEVRDLRDEVDHIRNGGAEEKPKDQKDDTNTEKRVTSIDTSFLPVALANEGSEPRARSYADYRGGRPQVRYRYPRRYYPRNYRAYAPRVYYYAPAYRYPAYVYPRTPNMMYYGRAARVYYGPWVYAY